MISQGVDIAFVESRLIEISKGASKGDISDFKKKVSEIRMVSYTGSTSLLYSKTNGYAETDFEDQQVLKGFKKNKVLDLLYSDEVGGLQGFCYNPRNAIILYNSEKEEIGYIEICFECTTMKSESNIPKLPQLSEVGYAELQSAFKKYGLLKSK